MARRFRRKPRVVWLPVQGNDIDDQPESGNQSVPGIASELNVNADGSIAFDQIPITFDYSDSASFEMGSFERSLQDLTSGNSYRLRRIVGKIFVGAYGTQNAGQIAPVDVACGFMVNKTDDSGNPLETGLFGNNQQRAPLATDAQQDPWIWRRRWLLTPVPKSVVVDASDVEVASDFISNAVNGPVWPQTNADYGSVADGPHIDQKTARIIGNQERLFFWISARQQQSLATGGMPVGVQYTLDVRLLASLRTNQGNRRNASR